MEETSPLTVATTNQLGETPADSSSGSHHHHPIKHPTSSDGALVSTSSKFKGVVSQPNGHWGAQIYANHQRIWLGTFKTEDDAATAYDSAAIKLRNGFTNRNFQWTDITVREPSFQEQFSTEVVLTMIKDGSYASKFSDYLRSQDQQAIRLTEVQDAPGMRLKQLFQKELTPSDVSKLNRLVIPKKFAVKYFPPISDVKEKNGGGNVEDIELVFFDRSMRSWTFRYCYWKSSQSFVFTRGWNRFAKEKGLRSRDRVIFSSYECNDQKLCVLDVAYDDRDRIGPVVEGHNDNDNDNNDRNNSVPVVEGNNDDDNDDDEALRMKIGPTYEIEEGNNYNDNDDDEALRMKIGPTYEIEEGNNDDDYDDDEALRMKIGPTYEIEEGNDDDEALRMKIGPTYEIDGMDVEGYAGMNEESGGEMKENVKGFKLFGVQII